jgi:hypothetical protein
VVAVEEQPRLLELLAQVAAEQVAAITLHIPALAL